MVQPTRQSKRWELACPRCRATLGSLPAQEEPLACRSCGASYGCCDGVWRLLPPEQLAAFAPFLRDYAAIRRAEGYGSADPAYYRRLALGAAPLAGPPEGRARAKPLRPARRRAPGAKR